jgi:hypothetical protein
VSSVRILQPPRDLDPQTRLVGQIAELNQRVTILERNSRPALYKVGTGTGFTVPFQNSYANYSPAAWAEAGWSVVGGRVYLQGLVFTTHAPPGNEVVFTLPSGLWPLRNHMFTTWSNAGAGRVDVHGNGNVVSFSTGGGAVGATAGGSYYLQLDGMSFAIGY